jgi:alcohol dehydrogenase
MPKRHVWRVHRAGSPGRLRLEAEQLQAPPSRHARVAVGAVGLNFADLAACLGLYSATPKGAFVPGLEFAGTVDAVGEGVDTIAPGERVIGLTRFGGYATHVNELGACTRGNAVLVQSAAGGVGLNALAILQGMGARVVVTVDQEGKVVLDV